MTKRILALLTSLLAITVSAYADSTISPTVGAGPIGLSLGNGGSVSASTFAIDSAYVHSTSGDAIGMKFEAPVSQTSAALTVYAYLSSETGTTTSVTAYIFDGPSGAMDDDRPSTAAAIDTSAVENVDGLTNSWISFDFSATTLTAGQTYWFVITNTTGTPASNFPTFLTRGLNGLTNARIGVWTTTAGFSTDPTAVSSATDAPIVLKFSDGTTYGNPYVASAAHASNTNDRGTRYTFPQPKTFCGFYTTVATATANTWSVYQGSTLVQSIPIDVNKAINAGFYTFNPILKCEANVPYDIVYNPTSNTTALARVHTNTSDADINAAAFSTMKYVDGATPGSYSATDYSSAGGIVLVECDYNTNQNANMSGVAVY